MKSLRVHRIGFFEPKPQAIRCMTFDPINFRLAASRSDSSIEIWDTREKPFLEKIIPNSFLSVEALTWCNERLFSAGLDGYIVEHDLIGLVPKNQIVATSGCPIWYIKPNKENKVLAIGNEDGHVVLYQFSTEELNFEKKFDKQEGAVLCLDWSHDSQFIVTGSLDAIRVYDVQSGHAVNRILLPRVSKNIPTVVWCIAVLSDMTIVSGDSCGKLSFWDGNTSALISAVRSKNGDILSLALSNDEEEIYASGVEPTITMYLKSQSNGLWMKSVERIVHTHDVRALQLVGKYLASGGDDCNMVFTKYPPKTTITCFPFCQRPYAVMATKSSYIMLQYPDSLQIYSLDQNTAHGEVPNPSNLLRVACKTGRIICSAVSSDGKWLAYSSQFKLKLFNIKMNEDNLPEAINNIDLPEEAPPTANIMLFTSDSKLIGCFQKSIFVISCESRQTPIKTVHEENIDIPGDCHLLEISPNDSYLACADHMGNTLIYDFLHWKVVCKLPAYKCQVTAMKFDPSSENLMVAYSDRKVIEYNIRKSKYSSWSKQRELQQLMFLSHHPFTSLCYISKHLLLQDENTLYSFDMENYSQSAKRLKNFESSERSMDETSFKTITKYEHISSIHSINDELVLIQINSNRILECLPPPVFKKKYGT